MKCVAHRLGLDWECRTPDECNNSKDAGDDSGGGSHSNLLYDSDGGSDSVGSTNDHSFDVDDSDDVGEDSERIPRTYKDDSSLKDQQSTGRKRAARWYPLDDTKLCEWAMKSNVGGGPHPITGCLTNLQQARHHGPDKNTLNNDKGNVHRICHTCHNRWHTLNDEDYVWNDVQNLHAPEPATIDDIAANEEFWAGRKLVKAKD